MKIRAQCPLGLADRCYCANHVISFPSAPSKTAVLLLAHGTPDDPEQIPEYLRYVTGGRPLPPEAIEEIRHRYSLIGHSPLSCWTLRQADQLSQALQMPVFAGMRNWQPFIADSVKAISSQGFERVIAICLAPQNSRTSVGMYRRALVGEASLPFALDFVEEWHDRPLLIKAFAEKLRSGYEEANADHGARLPMIFTAHSVPQRTINEGDPYETQAKETAALVAKEAELSADNWVFAFQSQGKSGGPWIGPTVEETILNLKAGGHRGVFVHPVGFLCDHVEVLYDIDIAFKAFAEKEGMRLWRGESLNGSLTLTAALSELVRSRVAVVCT
ncbi:MAG TPA: ferrochelatase [Terriglobales bacterium]|jgi:ferrochelatase|nr:ferrochelatase [Terriglobales bacterium]